MSTTLRLSVDQYERMIARGAFEGLDRRIELIHGELREMSPAGPLHDAYIRYLLHWSARIVADGKVAVCSQMGLLVNDNLPEPDFALLQPERYGRRRPDAGNVLLLVEVSDRSLQYDLTEKAAVYAGGGVVEYWVVDVAGSRVIRHLRPTESGFDQVEQFVRPDRVSPAFDPQLVFDLADLFLLD